MNYFDVIPKDIIFQVILYINDITTFSKFNNVMNNTLNNIDTYIYLLSNKYIIKGITLHDNTCINMNLYIDRRSSPSDLWSQR